MISYSGSGLRNYGNSLNNQAGSAFDSASDSARRQQDEYRKSQDLRDKADSLQRKADDAQLRAQLSYTKADRAQSSLDDRHGWLNQLDRVKSSNDASERRYEKSTKFQLENDLKSKQEQARSLQNSAQADARSGNKNSFAASRLRSLDREINDSANRVEQAQEETTRSEAVRDNSSKFAVRERDLSTREMRHQITKQLSKAEHESEMAQMHAGSAEMYGELAEQYARNGDQHGAQAKQSADRGARLSKQAQLELKAADQADMEGQRFDQRLRRDSSRLNWES
ncbi:MAG: hypothetical protein ACRC7C_18205 [Beijerinckiaceae bacterium]